jgi:hypothetical protein
VREPSDRLIRSSRLRALVRARSLSKKGKGKRDAVHWSRVPELGPPNLDKSQCSGRRLLSHGQLQCQLHLQLGVSALEAAETKLKGKKRVWVSAVVPLTDSDSRRYQSYGNTSLISSRIWNNLCADKHQIKEGA